MEQNKEAGGWPFHSYFEIYSKAQKKYLGIIWGLKKKQTVKKNPKSQQQIS